MVKNMKVNGYRNYPQNQPNFKALTCPLCAQNKFVTMFDNGREVLNKCLAEQERNPVKVEFEWSRIVDDFVGKINGHVVFNKKNLSFRCRVFKRVMS